MKEFNKKNMKKVKKPIKVAEGFGCEMPVESKCMEYVNKMGSAMAAWVECNEKDRGYILLAMGERNDGEDDSRSVAVSLGGSKTKLANMLLAVLETSEDFRKALVLAANMKMNKTNDE